MFEDKVEFAPHFAALAEGRLSFPRCTDCGRFHWYPMPLCPHCRSASIAWQVVRGDGELYSWTEIHHAFDPRYSGTLPYIVALVTFAEVPGIRLVTNLTGCTATALRVGMTLAPEYTHGPGGAPQVCFSPR